MAICIVNTCRPALGSGRPLGGEVVEAAQHELDGGSVFVKVSDGLREKSWSPVGLV